MLINIEIVTEITMLIVYSKSKPYTSWVYTEAREHVHWVYTQMYTVYIEYPHWVFQCILSVVRSMYTRVRFWLALSIDLIFFEFANVNYFINLSSQAVTAPPWWRPNLPFAPCCCCFGRCSKVTCEEGKAGSVELEFKMLCAGCLVTKLAWLGLLINAPTSCPTNIANESARRRSLSCNGTKGRPSAVGGWM